MSDGAQEEEKQQPKQEGEGENQNKEKDKPVYDVKAIGELTDAFFTRSKKGKPSEYRLCGDFRCRTDTWRIIGMQVHRDDPLRTNYDVIRINLEETGQTEYPRESRQHTLRLCRSDISAKQKEFLLEYRLFKLLNDVYVNWRQRRHFPEIFSVGAFEQLIYHDNSSSQGEALDKRLKIPRPYFILERLSFTVEELMWMPKNGYLDLPTACYVCIGMIKALRLIHELGYALRYVAPSHFSIRLPPSCLLFRTEAELSDRIALTAMPHAYKYIHAERLLPICGTYICNDKYSSPAAMELKGQTSVDDIISVFFIFYEMVSGTLPWTISRENKEVIAKKKEVMATDTIPDSKGKTVASGYSGLFKTVLNSDPYTFSLSYERLYTQIHKICADAKPEFSLFGLSSHNKTAYAEDFHEVDRDALIKQLAEEKKKQKKTKDETTEDTSRKKNKKESKKSNKSNKETTKKTCDTKKTTYETKKTYETKRTYETKKTCETPSKSCADVSEKVKDEKSKKK